MILYHVSPAKNDAGIRRHGIRHCRQSGKTPVVWLVDRRDIDWAIRHVIARHETRDITVWSVLVDRHDVLPAPHGRFMVARDLAPAELNGTIALPAWVWPTGGRDRDYGTRSSARLGRTYLAALAKGSYAPL